MVLSSPTQKYFSLQALLQLSIKLSGPSRWNRIWGSYCSEELTNNLFTLALQWPYIPGSLCKYLHCLGKTFKVENEEWLLISRYHSQCSSLGWEWPNHTSACIVSRQQLSNQRRLGSLGTDLRAGWQKNCYVEQCGWSLRGSESLFWSPSYWHWKWNVGGVFKNKLLRNLSEDWVTSHSRQMYLSRCPCY